MQRSKSLIRLIVALAFLFLGSAILAIFFLRSELVWNQLLQYDEPARCDVIFVPSGGMCSRFPRAAELFKEGFGDILFVTLEVRPAENSECVEKYDLLGQMGMIRRMVEVEGIPEEKLEIRGYSPSSYDDCLFLREYFETSRFDSVMIVTDPVHASRVVTLVESLMPELEVISCPTAEKDEVRKFYKNDLVYLASEYLKNLVYRIRY